jgi:hypothetical protein
MGEMDFSKEKTFYYGASLQGKCEVFFNYLAVDIFSIVGSRHSSCHHLSEYSPMVGFRWFNFLSIPHSIYCIERVMQQIENFERYSMVIPCVREASFISTFGPLPA